MKQIIQTGKTVDEAIQLACEALKVSQQHCSIEVLQHPKKSFFGLFRSPATVKVSHKPAPPTPPMTAAATSKHAPDAAAVAPVIPVHTVVPIESTDITELYAQKRMLAVDFVSRILTQIGLTDAKITEKQYETGVTLLVQSDQIGLLIGRRGETLEALQFLTNIVANRLEGKYFKVRINCGDYRSKQDDALRDLARSLGKQVVQTGEQHLCDPMNARDRKIIHAQIAGMPGVDTKSKGAEPNRQVLIFPAPQKLTGRSFGKHKSSGKSSSARVAPSPKQELSIEEIIKQERAAERAKAMANANAKDATPPS